MIQRHGTAHRTELVIGYDACRQRIVFRIGWFCYRLCVSRTCRQCCGDDDVDDVCFFHNVIWLIDFFALKVKADSRSPRVIGVVSRSEIKGRIENPAQSRLILPTLLSVVF